MRPNIKIILLLYLVTSSLITEAQSKDSLYFTDSYFDDCSKLYSSVKTDSTVIFATEKAVYEVDLNANVLWSSINYLNYYDESYFRSVQIFSVEADSILIGVTHKNNFSLYKVNRQKGNVALKYEKTHQFYGNQDVITTPSKTIIAYYDYTGKAHLISLDANFKEVSDHQLTFIKEFSSVNIQLEIDGSDDLYALTEDSLFKFNTLDPTDLAWKVSFTDPNQRLLFNTKLILTKTDDLIVANYYNNSTYFQSINKVNGIVNWQTKDQSYNSSPIAFVEDAAHIFYVSRHRNVGSGGTRSFVGKINKSSGTIRWNEQITQQPLGNKQAGNGNWESFLDLDLLSNGNLIATGYYGSSNFGPAAWGITVYDSSDATVISSFTITDHIADYDLQSVGEFVCTFNDTAYLLGELEKGTYRTSVTLAKYLPSNQIEWYKPIQDSLVQESSIKSISSKADSYCFLREHGDHAVVEKRDLKNTYLWSSSHQKPIEFLYFQEYNQADLLVTDQSAIIINKRVINGSQSRIYIDCFNALNGSYITTDSVTVDDIFLELIDGVESANSAVYYYQSNGELHTIVIQANSIVTHKKLADINSFKRSYIEVVNSEIRLLIGTKVQRYDFNMNLSSSTSIPSMTKINDFVSSYDTTYFIGSKSSKGSLAATQSSNNTVLFYLPTNGKSLDHITDDGGDNLFIVGEASNRLVIMSYIKSTRKFGWQNTIHNVYNDFDVSGLIYNPQDQTVSVYGSLNNSFTIVVYDTDGNELYRISKADENGGNSIALGAQILNDSSLVFGGVHNLEEYFFSALIYRIGQNVTGVNSIKFSSQNKSALVYPNPAYNTLHLLKVKEFGKFHIYNINGVNVKSGIYKPSDGIELSSLNSGTYFLSYEVDGYLYRMRFIVEK